MTIPAKPPDERHSSPSPDGDSDGEAVAHGSGRKVASCCRQLPVAAAVVARAGRQLTQQCASGPRSAGYGCGLADLSTGDSTLYGSRDPRTLRKRSAADTRNMRFAWK